MIDRQMLSPREQEILALVAQGLTNREIAQRLSISPNTVKVHLSNIFEKAGVASRTEATLYGIEQGIVDVPGTNGSQTEPLGWRSLLRQFRWVWVALLGLVILALFSVSANLIFPAPVPEPAAGQDLSERWQKLAPLPETLRGMAVTVYDGDVFTLGGGGPEGVSGSVYTYDFEEGGWNKRREKPTAVTDVQGVTISEKIYVPGGKRADGTPTDVLEIYDPRTDTWETGASLPVALSAYALADFEGLIFVFGGWDGDKEVPHVWKYDPDTDSWHDGDPMDQSRAFARAVAQEDRIILIGGRFNGQALADVSAYFPTRDAAGDDPWVDFIDLPDPRYAFGAAGVADNIYLLGGKPGKENGQDTGGLLMNGEAWVALPTEPDYNGRETVMVSQGSLLAILDTGDQGAGTTVWTYQVFYFSIYIPIVQ